MNIKRYISAMIIFIIIIMTTGGCSSDGVENEPSEAHASDIQSEDKNSMNDLDAEVEISKDVDIQQEKVELSPEEQREINIFLSNFTEVFFPDFDGVPSNEILVDFGVRHNDINNFNAIKVKDNYGFLGKSVYKLLKYVTISR